MKQNNIIWKSWFLVTFLLLQTFINFGCKVGYSFKDVSIPPEIKTIKINYIENKARYINTQLSPRLTDKLQLKVASQTKLIRTNNDDAHYIVSGFISDYAVTTAAITTQQATTNRLTVSAHITLKNTLDNKSQEFDATRNFDFSANLSLQEAENQLIDQIVNNLSDEIFNHLFSNW